LLLLLAAAAGTKATAAAERLRDISLVAIETGGRAPWRTMETWR
jgi:hypothetical protein